jgi:soluble cytochrome b562
MINVSKADLLAKLKDNLESHRKIFLEAQKGYRKQVIEELDKMISDAKDGKPIKRSIVLPEPSDHTEDYKVVIEMLEMSIDKTFEISQHEFRNYVLDKWDWSQMAFMANSKYLNK